MAINVPIAITPGNNLLPSLFYQMVLGQGEYPTSTKFNTFSTFTGTQFSLEEMAIGSLYSLGQPSLAFTIGDPRSITTLINGGSDSSLYINSFPAAYNSSNSYLNELPATGSGSVITLNGSGLINGSNSANFSGTSGSVQILNIMVAQKNGNGQIVNIIPGAYSTVSSWSLGTDITSFTIPGTTLAGTYYVLVPNYSLSSSIVTNMSNIGSMIFSRRNGFVNDPVTGNADDSVQTFPANQTVTLTNLANRMDGKLFTVRFHIKATLGTAINQTFSSVTYATWTITGSTIQAGIVSGHPAPATIQAFISSNIIAPLQANNAAFSQFAVINGAAITDTTGTIIAPYLNYSNQTLTVGIPTSTLAFFASSTPNQNPAYIDFYIPLSLPYYALQSRNLSFNSEGMQVNDLIKNVIGSQYGWNQSLSAMSGIGGSNTGYPDTIGNRLSNLESSFNNLSALQGAVIQYNAAGTYSFTTGSNTHVIKATLVGAGGGGGGSTTTAGNRAGGGGGQGGVVKTPIIVTPNTTYTLIVGAGGTGPFNSNVNGNAGGSTIFQLGASIILKVTGGNGGNSGASGGNGGSGGSLNTFTGNNYTIINTQTGGTGTQGPTSLSESNGGAGGNIILNGNPYLHTSGGQLNSQDNGGGITLPNGPGAGGSGAANGSVNQGGQTGNDGLVVIEY